jgi:tRNA threonylcarbamoyladenosine biosynthesis protein TsaB
VIILALDTTSEYGSVAVRSNGRTLVDLGVRSAEGFAHLIFPAIDESLKAAEVRFGEVDCFAAASGPGSFTGVRIGLAAIKGLAAAAARPAIGISNLRALSSFGNSALRAVVLDARRGEVYGGVYNADLEPVLPEVVAPYESWLRSLDPALKYGFVSQSDPPLPLASAVALCAELDGLKDRWLDAADIDANYVRRSDAELYWKDPKPVDA